MMGFDTAPPERECILTPVDLTDLMTADLEPTLFVVNPWLPRRHVTLFGGHGGTGKSSLALALAAHVACGRPFGGMPVTQLPVLFVSLEDEPRIVRHRLRRIIEYFKLPSIEVLKDIRLLDGTERWSALATEEDGGIALTLAFRELKQAASGAGLIVVDNSSDAFEGNENARRDVRFFVRALASLAREQDAALMLLAHIDKLAARGAGAGNSYSGSTAWHNSSRSRLALLGDEDGRIQVLHEKANLSARADPLDVVFVDGLPVPAPSVGGEQGLTGQDFDDAEIVRALRAAAEAGIFVPASLTPGAHCAMKALEPLPEFWNFKGRRGRDRAAEAITRQIRNGRIRRIEYKTPQRKIKTRLELVAGCAES